MFAKIGVKENEMKWKPDIRVFHFLVTNLVPFSDSWRIVYVSSVLLHHQVVGKHNVHSTCAVQYVLEPKLLSPVNAFHMEADINALHLTENVDNRTPVQ